MRIKYRGFKILIKLVKYNEFKYASFNYGKNIVVLFNTSIDRKERSDLLHKIIKKAKD